MPEPLTIASTVIGGARLSLQVCKEAKKVCRWLTGNLDSVGRFSRADSLPPGELVAKYYEYYIDNIQNQMELDEALAKLHSTEKKTKWFTCKKKRVKSEPVAVKLLFEGAPLIGKTRAVCEKVIKKLPDFIVFMPSHVELGKIKVSELKQSWPGKRGLILFLDDLDQFVAQQNVDLRYLIQHLQAACPRLVVVATLRTGIETTDKVMAERHGRDLLQGFLEISFRDITNEEAGQLAKNVGRARYEFDGSTPGSVVLGLTEMQHRLEKLNRPFREICMALKLLYFAFLPVPEKELVKKVSDTVFHTGFGGDPVGWGDYIKKLKDNDLIRDLGESITTPHSDYHRHVYDPDYDPAQDLPRLKDIFAEKRDVPALSGLGTSFLIMDNYQEAITCYDKALEIDLKDVQVWCNKGVALGNLGRYEEAITCCNKALEIDPNDAQAWCTKGVALGKLGRHEEAITCCDKALEIDPSFLPGLKEILEKLREFLGEGGLNPPEAP